ncbi:MAG: nucleotidyltransferase domain-containing protein [Bacteroidetes bacterium]|nr:MAG: nucleotidyltransferase domain-containing protein [Bacteroidota bacterium]
MDVDKNKILLRIKNAVQKIEPDSEIFLFGSRARGDYNEHSDWDLLIILPGELTFSRKMQVTKRLFEIELSENQLFNRIFFNRDNWLNNKLIHASPFYENVIKDYILI